MFRATAGLDPADDMCLNGCALKCRHETLFQSICPKNLLHWQQVSIKSVRITFPISVPSVCLASRLLPAHASVPLLLPAGLIEPVAPD